MDEETQEFGERYGDDGSEEETNQNDVSHAELPEGWTQDEYDAYLQEESDEASLQQGKGNAPATPVAEAEYTPPAYTVPLLAVEAEALFTEDEQEQLNDMFLNGQGAQATAIITQRSQQQTMRQMQRMMQAQVLHGNTLAAAETETGEWYRQHGATIRQTMATLPPEQAGTETAKFAALIAPALYEVQAGADAVKTFTRMARMAQRQAGQQGNAPAPTPQAPPRVAPAGSRTGGNPVGRPANEVQELMKLTGMNRMEAESTLRGMQETGAAKRGGGGYR